MTLAQNSKRSVLLELGTMLDTHTVASEFAGRRVPIQAKSAKKWCHERAVRLRHPSALELYNVCRSRQRQSNIHDGQRHFCVRGDVPDRGERRGPPRLAATQCCAPVARAHVGAGGLEGTEAVLQYCTAAIAAGDGRELWTLGWQRARSRPRGAMSQQ